MAEIQKLTCPECEKTFEFDPNEDNSVVTRINEGISTFKESASEKSLIAYLTCPEGHVKRYKVNVNYNGNS